MNRLVDDFPTETEALRRRAFFRLARRFTPSLGVDRGDLRFVVSTGDLVLGRRLFCYPNTAELDIVRAFATLDRLPGVRERLGHARVLEIGANIGSHTVEMIRHFGVPAVTAIEPDRENFVLLEQNVLINGVANRVTAMQIAMSDRDGEVELELSPTNPGDHRVKVSEAPASGTEPARATRTVPSRSVDSLIATGELDLADIGVLWMDAQGHEAHILAGAQQLLSADVAIVMEYWPYGLRRANALDLLHEIISAHFSQVIDVDPPASDGPAVFAATELAHLEERYGWGLDGSDPEAGTDIVLTRGELR